MDASGGGSMRAPYVAGLRFDVGVEGVTCLMKEIDAWFLARNFELTEHPWVAPVLNSDSFSQPRLHVFLTDWEDLEPSELYPYGSFSVHYDDPRARETGILELFYAGMTVDDELSKVREASAARRREEIESAFPEHEKIMRHPSDPLGFIPEPNW